MKKISIVVCGFAALASCLLPGCTKDNVQAITPEDLNEGQTNWTKSILFEYPDGEYNLLCKVHFVDANTGIAAGAHGGTTGEPGNSIYRTTDGGTSWTKVEPIYHGIGDHIVDFHFSTPTVGYALSYSASSKFLKTTDAGATWTYMDIVPGFNDESKVFFTDANNGFVLGPLGIWRTTDGATFSLAAKSYSGTYTYSGIYFPTHTTGYAVTTTGVIVKSTDAGYNWDSLYVLSGKHLTSLFFTDSLSGFCGTRNGLIFKTTDGGNTWSVCTMPAVGSMSVTDIRFFSGSTGFATVAKNEIGPKHGYILKTTDGGMSWSINYTSSLMNFRSVCAVSADVFYATGDPEDSKKMYVVKTTTQVN